MYFRRRAFDDKTVELTEFQQRPRSDGREEPESRLRPPASFYAK